MFFIHTERIVTHTSHAATGVLLYLICLTTCALGTWIWLGYEGGGGLKQYVSALMFAVLAVVVLVRISTPSSFGAELFDKFQCGNDSLRVSFDGSSFVDSEDEQVPFVYSTL